jgi:hypothetical protein
MVTIMPGDSCAGSLELGAGRLVHVDFFTVGRGILPLEVADFVIGVNVELSGQGKVGICDLVILMAFHVFERRRGGESLESEIDMFQNIPIWCEGGGGVGGRVLAALQNTC